jgi:uncharacterized protein (TIGR02145 family)
MKRHPSICTWTYLFLFVWAVSLPLACDKNDPADDEIPVLTVSDFDGNIYRTVLIGDQLWMASNLKTSHYADGTEIYLLESNSEWEALDIDAKAYCYYDNDADNESFTYGALYTWAAIMNGAQSTDNNPSRIQGVCPDGWHVPSDSEWKELEMYLGMGKIDADTTGPRGISIGSQLADNRDLWADGLLKNNPAFGGTGFLALPGGGRRYNGTFGHVGDNANFWSATGADLGRGWTRHIYSEYSTIHRYRSVKSDGFSVRCIKD